MKIIPLSERFFESIDNTLYVFDKTLIESEISVQYFWKIKAKGHSSILAIDHPSDKRKNIYAFETLSKSYQEKIIKRFGNPYDYIAREPILRMLQPDDNAYQFFLSYRYNGDKILPINRVKQYTRAACWLNLLKQIEDSRHKLIKEMGIKVPDFFTHVEALMESEKENGASDTYNGDNQLMQRFPTSARKLIHGKDCKLTQYKEHGYVCLIDKMYGNQLAAKVTDEVAESNLLELIADPRGYDDVMIAYMYNIWATNNNYSIITPATVGVWRRKSAFLVTMSREGNSAFNERFIRQVKGLKVTTPMRLIEHDDNNLDFLFTDENDYAYNRYVSIVVADSFNGLVLGKSYTRQTKDMKDTMQQMIRHAYLDAMYYIRSKTGSWYLPFEIKSDHYAIKSLTPFYNSVGKFVPPAHANKHRGYIEQLFGSPMWKRAQQLVSQGNWNGNNVTAKNPGVNKEWLDLNTKNRPMVGTQAEMQIEKFFHLLRHLPDFKREQMEAPSREQQWLQAFSEMKPEDKRPISDEQFLLTFGITHNPRNPIKITNRGIEPQIDNKRLSYDLPEPWMYNKYNGAKVNVVIDPFDMSRVLITNNDDIRFIATTAQYSPRALQDTYTSSRTYLNAVLAEKKDQVKEVAASTDRRKGMVDDTYFNAEAMIQGGVMIKEIKNEAEQRYLEGTTGYPVDDSDPFDQM
jgi:hypothetical protein